MGANGIILVTTKKGKKNTKTKVSYNGSTGFQEASRKLPLLNATEYALLVNESYAAAGQAVPYPNAAGLGKGTDWQDELFRKGAPIINNDFSFSGGSDKVVYAVSASDLTQEGIIGEADKSKFKRNTARMSLGFDVTDKFKVQATVNYAYIHYRNFNDSGLGSVLFNAVNAPPTLSPYDADGNYSLVPSTPGLGAEIINPLAQLDNTFNDNVFKRLSGNFSIDYEILKGLTITSRIGFNSVTGQAKNFAKIVDYGPSKVFNVTRSRVDQNQTNSGDYTFDLFATYKKNINNHHFAVTVINTIYKEYFTGLYASGYDIPYNSWAFADIKLATGTSGSKDVASGYADERRLSYIGRLQYDFKEKYLLSFVYRRDGSTRFGPSNTVAEFPSMTAGWVISNEPFFPTSETVNFLKVRGSYGSLGNDQIGSNRYTGTLSGEATYVFDGALVNGTAIGVIPNPNIKWEVGRKFDVGLDTKLFNNKVNITADYYNDRRSDLLIEGVPASAIAGGAAPGSGNATINAGTTTNKGFEFAIDYATHVSNDLSFRMNYNLTTISNNVTEVKTLQKYVEGGGFGVGQQAPSRMVVNHDIGYYYGYQTDGIFQNEAEVNAHPSQAALGAPAQPGDIRFKDINGDGVIDPNDRTDLGSPVPTMVMGFNFDVNYKGFDLSAYTYASIGNEIARNYERVLSDVNRSNVVLDRSDRRRHQQHSAKSYQCRDQQ
ncbi:SusC/RagA family TonB-linked outer membrane protein [Flavobacterium sp. 3HN19-14]|uniref:SusC/RagA family TonB-linked outer membrane protein n=1 Tax=Flavobacterium sp. 3HN19-14 TaxID=3448133 RepID=UPI003EE185EB